MKGIYTDSISIPLDKYEFKYSEYLKSEPVYIFFDQGNMNTNEVILINDAKDIGRIFSNSFGMEYFLTNMDFTFLLSVNWYVIEGSGEAVDWIKLLKN